MQETTKPNATEQQQIPARMDVRHEVAQKIIESFMQPLTLAGEQVVVTTSIGIALCPEHAGDPETLLRLADQAMYSQLWEAQTGLWRNLLRGYLLGERGRARRA